MKVFSLSASDEACQLFQSGTELDDWYRLSYPQDRTADRPWTPIHVELTCIDEEGRARQHVDFPSHGYDCLIMSATAKDALHALLAPHGEFLKLACDEADLYVFDVSTQIDALDAARSSPLYDYDDDGEPIGEHLGITTPYAFFTERLGDACIFRVPQLKTFFLTERFVQAVKDLDLRGLAVRTEFDSERDQYGFDHLGRPLTAPRAR